jgi:hypothetical protein
MKRVLDLFRATLISPEVVALLFPFAVLFFWPEPAIFVGQQFSTDIKWAFGAAVVPAGFMLGAYKIGDEILSPQGARRVLLDWPDYPMLKDRVVLALVFCGVGLGLGLAGAFVVGMYRSALGATLIFSGLLSSTISLVTISFAKWKVREFLRV